VPSKWQALLASLPRSCQSTLKARSHPRFEQRSEVLQPLWEAPPFGTDRPTRDKNISVERAPMGLSDRCPPILILGILDESHAHGLAG
jgi:hypothetical protein